MHVNGKRLVGLWMALLSSVATLAAIGDAPLVEAVRSRNREAVRGLLQKQIDVNARQPDGATALHWAVYLDDLDTADLLIRAGASVQAANQLGVTPLYLACENGSETLIEKLLAAGANPNIALPSGETALMTAARSGSVAAVKALLARGADLHVREKTEGQTALMWAAAQRHPDVVKALIDAGADVRARSQVRRVVAARSSSASKEAVSVIEEGGFTPLLFAARQGDIASARLLLAAGAHVNDTAPIGMSALLIAAQSGDLPFAEFLLREGANPNDTSMGYTALHAAVLAGDLDLVKALLARGASPNAQLTNGTPVGRRSKALSIDAALAGATPFFLAAKFAEADIMRVLVDAGADPLLGLKDGTTPLLVAAGMRSTGLSRGEPSDRRGRAMDPAEVDLVLGENEDQRNIMGSGIAAVRLAVELGADVNAVNQAGDTALHSAALHGFETVIQFLVEKGAKLDAKNKQGQTALTAVNQRGLAEDKVTADFLRKLGAKE